MVIAELERAVEQSVQINLFFDDLSGRSRFAFFQKVAAAQFFRRQADSLRDLIEVAFHREDALRSAEAAKGSVWRMIGGNGFAANSDGWPVVRPGGVNCSARQHYRRKRRINSAVNREINFRRQQLAVFADCCANARSRRMAFGCRDHVFGAVVNHLDRFARFPRQQSRVSCNHRRIFFLATKPAAGHGLHHANFFRRQIKQLQQRFVNVIRALHRTPDGYAFCRVGDGDHAVRFDIQLLLSAGFVFAFDDKISLRPSGIHVAFLDQKLFEDVVFAPDGLGFVQRIFDGENGGQRFDVERDRTPGFFQQVFVFVRQQQNRLFRMVYKFISQIRLIFQNQRHAVSAGNIFGGDDGEFVPGNAVAELNAAQPSARNRRTHSHAVQHVGKGQIVHIPGVPGDFINTFFAEYRLANDWVWHTGQCTTDYFFSWSSSSAGGNWRLALSK